nr:MAG TPA: hypothetical protein [Caudoviricetes sp.]
MPSSSNRRTENFIEPAFEVTSYVIGQPIMILELFSSVYLIHALVKCFC